MSDPWDRDYRHVGVAILYGLGQKDRAQHIARKLQPRVITMDDVSESELKRVRDKFNRIDAVDE